MSRKLISLTEGCSTTRSTHPQLVRFGIAARRQCVAPFGYAHVLLRYPDQAAHCWSGIMVGIDSRSHLSLIWTSLAR